MAGEWLIEQMQSKGGQPNEYADLVYGIVTSLSPLAIQASNNMVLLESMLHLGLHVTRHTVKLTYPDNKINSIDFNGKKYSTGDLMRTETVIVDESLNVGDRVAMIRLDGGQSFYIFEKLGAGD
jgi:hypothetical protein